MSRFRLSLPKGDIAQLSDPRILAPLATAIAAIVLAACLYLGAESVFSRRAEAEAMREQLAALLARPLPKREQATAAASDGRDFRLFPGATKGEALAAMQARLTEMAEQSALRLRRVSVENVDGADPAANRLAVRLEAEGDTNALQQALFRIETGYPYFEVDLLDVQRAEAAEADQLDITATVLATWQEPEAAGGPGTTQEPGTSQEPAP